METQNSLIPMVFNTNDLCEQNFLCVRHLYCSQHSLFLHILPLHFVRFPASVHTTSGVSINTTFRFMLSPTNMHWCFRLIHCSALHSSITLRSLKVASQFRYARSRLLDSYLNTTFWQLVRPANLNLSIAEKSAWMNGWQGWRSLSHNSW